MLTGSNFRQFSSLPYVTSAAFNLNGDMVIPFDPVNNSSVDPYGNKMAGVNDRYFAINGEGGGSLWISGYMGGSSLFMYQFPDEMNRRLYSKSLTYAQVNYHPLPTRLV
jgi:hypothetical protein